LKATDASVDDTVDGIFDVVLAVLVVLVVEERRQLGLDWRLTTKHGGGTVVVVVVGGGGGGVGRAIALKATDASVDDTVNDSVDGIFDVVLAVLLVLVVEERRQLGLDWRLTTKHVGGTVVVVVVIVVGRAIALKATDASVDGIFDGVLAGLGRVVLCVAVKSNLLKRASLASNC